VDLLEAAKPEILITLIAGRAEGRPDVLLEGKVRDRNKQVCVDSPKFICYNITTHEFGYFMLAKTR
jgi:hypothetical protein